ncbi:MAG: hypothetical protein TH68_02895 [Candidatus Synechococcus spongiarum 142]|uniref:2-oxoisovalerate dehydrogenase n=1 Tax=Candidatus Synechococcus spongiarum 142 TaxID=1608213 RepID=A0A6N3X9B2_9SYNE|nr:MAG: hypothetical protein TH68_02895 [Candidatus Synechococcus spongiarum 142]
MNHNEVIFEVSELLKAVTMPGCSAPTSSPKGKDWDDLKDMVRDAVRCHFTANDVPGVIRLHYVRDEAIAA